MGANGGRMSLYGEARICTYCKEIQIHARICTTAKMTSLANPFFGFPFSGFPLSKSKISLLHTIFLCILYEEGVSLLAGIVVLQGEMFQSRLYPSAFLTENSRVPFHVTMTHSRRNNNKIFQIFFEYIYTNNVSTFREEFADLISRTRITYVKSSLATGCWYRRRYVFHYHYFMVVLFTSHA